MKQLLLSDIELFILLKASGIDQINYYSSNAAKEERNVPYTIHGMVRKGILESYCEELRIKEPYRQILKALKDWKQLLTIHYGAELKDVVHLYFSTEIILLQDNLHRENGVMIGKISKQELSELLEEILSVTSVLELPNDIEAPDIPQVITQVQAVVERRISISPGIIETWSLVRGKYKNYVKHQNEQGEEDWCFRQNWDYEILLNF